ncbi:MAG: vWA domain-containing protein [Acidaminobacteraceae bacterium]
MNINITSMILIICALVALTINIRIVYSIKNISKNRRFSILVTRVLLIILITLGGLGISLISKSDVIHTVFLVDRSSSMEGEKENVELFINDAIKRKSVSDRVSIISFAGDVSTDYTSFSEKREIVLNSVVNKNATNYEDSLDRAKAMILPSESGRVVLIFDGHENQSDYNNISEEFKLKNNEFKFVKIDSNQSADSQVTDIKIPREITVGESFQIDLELYSTKKSSAILRIYKGSEIFSEKEIMLSKGKNNYTYKDVLFKSGNQIYTAEIDMIDDFYVNNNKFSTMTNGVGSPRLLVIGNGEGSEEYIRKLASDNGFNVDTYKSEDSPS